jgi:hypothetical protein
MTSFRRIRLGPLIVTAAVTAVVALFGLPAPHANAFLIQNHETITRAALPQIPNDVMLQILVGPPPGAGAVGTDAFFNEDFRHLDNAPNPTQMCTEAQQGWNTFVPIILSGSQVVGGGLADGPAARSAFGGLIHVQQDFYAHSNWVDMQGNQIAPQIFPTCDPGAFPADFYTGYFELTLGNHEDPLSGCPPGGPPPGFQQCHSTLNKDSPNTANGSQPAPGTNMTKYDVAAQLATTATTTLYNTQIRPLVANTNGEQAAVLLFGGDGGTGGTPAPVSAGFMGSGK